MPTFTLKLGFMHANNRIHKLDSEETEELKQQSEKINKTY